MELSEFKNMLQCNPGMDMVATEISIGWGDSCASGRGRYNELPIGVDAYVGLEKWPDTTLVPYVHVDYTKADNGPPAPNRRYAVSARSFDVGAGNYLNVRVMHVIDTKVVQRLFSLTPNLPGANLGVKIKEGPPVYACYWAGLYSLWTYCANQYVNKTDGSNGYDLVPGNLAKQRKETIAVAKQLKGCTLTFLINKMYEATAEEIFKAFGWDDKILWKTSLCNRSHEGQNGDYLFFYVIQLKD